MRPASPPGSLVDVTTRTIQERLLLVPSRDLNDIVCGILARGQRRGLPSLWYAYVMFTTIDKAGRVVVPAEIRRRLGLEPGTEIEIRVEGFSIRLVRAVPGPEVVRRGQRLVARPSVPEHKRSVVDIVRMIEDERDRWPG